ncbi:MAG: PQQ-dependent sugar dehydrogenase [Vicinamibacterales bacterium]
MTRWTAAGAAAIAVAGVAVYAVLAAMQPARGGWPGVDSRPPNAPSQQPAFDGQTRAPAQALGVEFEVVTVADGLDDPWGLAFLPDGRMLVTERPGALRVVNTDGSRSAPLTGLPAVDGRGQGGLLDVTLDPEYDANHRIYWSYAEPRTGGANHTAVARGTLADGEAPAVDGVEVIFQQAPSLRSTLHFGSRLVWHRDDTLFITMGDRSITEGRMQSQRLDGLLGKIARINRDGSIPADNPYVGRADVPPALWSIGHRNIQAAALHPQTGELWAVEHGTRGGDEINIARAAHDFGWPTIAYGIEYGGGPITGGFTRHPAMEQPRYYWDPVIAPSGMAFYTADLFPAWQGSLFIGGHGSRELVRLSLDGERVIGEERLLGDRREPIRDVRQGPDGALYLLTDGGNGKLLKLVPKGSTP